MQQRQQQQDCLPAGRAGDAGGISIVQHERNAYKPIQAYDCMLPSLCHGMVGVELQLERSVPPALAAYNARSLEFDSSKPRVA